MAQHGAPPNDREIVRRFYLWLRTPFLAKRLWAFCIVRALMYAAIYGLTSAAPPAPPPPDAHAG